MNYHVYRFYGTNSAQHLASTRFKEDAERIYSQWNRAYIVTDSGEIIAIKGD